MKNTVKIAAAALAALLLLQLFACAPAEETATDTDTTAAASDGATTAADSGPEEEPFSISVSGGSARVTASGISYTATGFKSVEDGTFRFRDGFSAVFDENSGRFNRMIFDYSSTEPMEITVAYSENGSEKTAQYYAEAAENGVFSCLIRSYAEGGLAASLLSLTAKTCSKAAGCFVIRGVGTEEIPLINKVTYYLENARYKVGINLLWGGGINYVEDKTCKIKNLTNLVNKHDTGRLIQQSYYGTAGNDEYQPGEFMNARWVYNPVQGGDKHGNASRLIDLRISENSVYIKAQPLDWSGNNYATPSYMENTYTVTDDYVRVDNRFVDFSGWEHRYAAQELPALYTVSYLSRFTWYDGIKPWQGDELSYRDDLKFWGDAAYVNDCTFTVKSSNTETWCAWTNPEADFGLGIYVPNVDVFKAGRYGFNNTKKASDDPTNYVAPIDVIKMTSFVPIEYSYLLASGSIGQIRKTFTDNKDFADNASLHVNYIPNRAYGGGRDMTDAVFENEGDTAMITSPNNTIVTFSREAGAAALTCSGADPHVSFDYSAGKKYDAKDRTVLTVEYMIPEGGRSYSCDLFICAGGTTSPDGNKRIRKDLTADGQFHTLTVDLSKYSYWNGEIHLIRFDYFDSCSEGDTLYLRSFKLS